MTYRRGMTVVSTLAVGVSAVLALGACDDSRRAAAGSSAAPALEARLDQTIGSGDDSATNLTQIGDIVLGETGSIVVAQPRDNHLKVFSPAGQRIGTVGRSGKGPGEFQQILRIGWLAGELYVLDAIEARGRRAHFFSPTGTLRLTSVVPAVAFDSTIRLAQVLGLLDGGRRVVAPASTEMLEIEDRLPILLVDSGGRVLRRIGDVRRRRSVLHFEGQVTSIPGIADSIEDFPLVVIPPDGKWVTIVERYAAPSPARHTFAVTRFTSAGTEEWRRTIEYTPRRLPPTLAADAIVEAFVAGRAMSRSGLSPSARRQMVIDAIRPIDFYPPVFKARAGADGTIWILESAESADTVRWRVLDPRGEDAMIVRLPAAFDVRLGGSNFVIGAQLDSLDVPLVVRYSIEGKRD